MRKKVISTLMILSLFVCTLNILQLKSTEAAKDDESPKLQLNTYLSFGAEILDTEFGYLDKDDKLDLAVAFEDSVFIYEEEGDTFESVWSIATGDDNFISDSSNISTLTIGDTIDRNHIDQIDDVSNVENSTNCIVLQPQPHNATYLNFIDDGLFYNTSFLAEKDGYLNVTLKVHFGMHLNTFNISLRINDNLYSPGPTSKVSLLIFNAENSIFEEFSDITNLVGSLYNYINLSSTSLSNVTTSYINANNEIKLQIRYNHTQNINVKLDYVGLSLFTYESERELIIGGGQGEICTIQCTDSAKNEYKPSINLAFDDYGTGSENKKTITDLLAADIDADGKDEVIIANLDPYVYVLQSNKQAVKDYDLLVPRLDAEAGAVMAISSMFVSSTFSLCLGSSSGAYYTTTYEDISEDFVRPLVKKVASDVAINDIEIADIVGDINYEIIVASQDRTLRVFNNVGVMLWDENKFVTSGNDILSLTTGDFIEKGELLIALGSSQDSRKIKLLDPSDDLNLNWESNWSKGINNFNFIREGLVKLQNLDNSKEDTLVVITKRHMLFITKDYSDSDEDKLSDLSEKTWYLTDSEKADSDEDGLNDHLEIYKYGTDPMKADTDGDLVPDGLEISMGTDPLNPASSIILFITIPVIMVLVVVSIVVVVRRGMKQKRADYNRVKDTPNLMPQVQRLIIQRLETFAKEFKGFKNKSEMSKFRRNLSNEMMTIVLDRLYNFLEYLRLKGILFTTTQEEILKQILRNTLKPVEKDADNVLKSLLMYETKYKEFNPSLLKMLDKYADWKKAAVKGTKVVEELIKCPKCQMLGPKGSAFCLECGEKLVK